MTVSGPAAIDDGAERELGLEGRADLAHEHQVERGIERPGDLEAHGHAAARQSEDHGSLILEAEQPLSKPAPCLGSIREERSRINIAVNSLEIVRSDVA